MEQPSRQVTSNQAGVHENLERVVLRNWHNTFQRPIQAHNLAAFEQLEPIIAGRPIILDAGCGTGQSTEHIAQRFPQAFVIGIDKSQHRLQRHNGAGELLEGLDPDLAANFCLLRADLVDFWRLARGAGLKPQRHYILYPNPWPRKQQLQRRWHGSALFRDIIALGGELELRSNWRIYLEEFAHALEIVGQHARIEPVATDATPISAFESKYRNSGQALWRLRSSLKAADD